ncbi:MAG: SDR family oxidoreductase [Planctomycetes bacterium]|nr:SDR family oxidoreductase [Planctomycetota bacterium]
MTITSSDLVGRVALVPGITRGIGMGIAQSLASRGCSIVGIARTESDLIRSRVDLLKIGAPVVLTVAANLWDVDESMGRLRATVDLATIDILVANCGHDGASDLLKTPAIGLLDALNSQLLVFHEMVRIALPCMNRRGFGRVIAITGAATREPSPLLSTTYIAKSAVACWAKLLSKMVANGVTVNSVLPGLIRTDGLLNLVASSGRDLADWVGQVPTGVLGEPQDIRSLVAFLSSKEAGYINGANIPVDGGRLRGLW